MRLVKTLSSGLPIASPLATFIPASRIACQCGERTSPRDPTSSTITRQVTPRAAALFSASMTLRPLLSASHM